MMKRISKPVYPLLAFLLGSIAAIAIPATGQQKTVKQVPPAPTTLVDGKALFKQYCAVCHGIDGKGNGPAAGALKQEPGDLTQYARRNGGRFPEDKFMRILDGEESVAAHGNHDMPIWGAIFNKMDTNATLVQMRLHALLDYVEQIQAK
jgi:mono/diheme cytochrome c family protein